MSFPAASGAAKEANACTVHGKMAVADESRGFNGGVLPNHAMLLQGVHLDPAGKPVRWRIENSWGDESGKDGDYVASDNWLGEYAYQFVVNKKYLDASVLACLGKPPIVLPAWDPMGTLAD